MMQLPREMSNFVAADRGAQYRDGGVGFLRQNAVGSTAFASVRASVEVPEQEVSGGFGIRRRALNEQAHPFHWLDPSNEARHLKVLSAESGIHSVIAAGAHEASPLVAYYLPWDTNVSYGMNLDDDADFFFTAPMNGCAFLVAGSAKKPSVCHANYYLDPEQNAQLSDVQRHARRRRFYQLLATTVMGEGTTVLHPDFYLSPGGVKSVTTSAFGFRDRGTGNWSFHYHVVFGSNEPWANANGDAVVVQRQSKPYFMTGPLWPALTLPAWRSVLGHYFSDAVDFFDSISG